MLGGLLHIAMHAFGKITLFFCAGAIFVATGKKKISEMAGLGQRMPLTMLAFFLGSLSVIGLPPTGGFLSKWALLLGTIETGRYGLMVVLLGSSFLNAAYFLPIVYRAFFVPAADPPGDLGVREAPLWCLVPLCLTALATCALFFYPDLFMRLAQQALARP
jgi:multicomponent Na+:H+ antiporter subunit D